MGKVSQLSDKLSDKDIEVLYSIYTYRCLNEDSLYRLFFSKNKDGKDIDISYTRRKITFYKKLGLICEDRGDVNIVYFLTPKAIDILKLSFHLQEKELDINRNIFKKGFLKASELRISKSFIDHQTNLNNFVTSFVAKLKKENINLNYKYYDEKYLSQYNNIRPDGLIQFLGMDFFLEMDMGTEAKAKLIEKWNHYRSFLISNEFGFSERKIVMFFILGKSNLYNNNLFVRRNAIKSIEKRRNIVVKSISDNLIDTINSNFEIYVGTQEELLNLIFNEFIPFINNNNSRTIEIKKTLELIHGFTISNAELLKTLDNSEYDMYIRKINTNNNIIVENKKIQEFLVDDFCTHPLSILKKISYLDINNSLLIKKFKRVFSYVIIFNSEEEAYRYLSLGDCLTTKNVYLTTINRLKTKPLNEALFIIRKTGDKFINYYHFSDTGLELEVLEKSINLE